MSGFLLGVFCFANVAVIVVLASLIITFRKKIKGLQEAHEQRVSLLEADLWKAKEEIELAWSRYEGANRLALGYMQDRMKTCDELRRFGMLMSGKNELIVRGNHMPVMAIGIEQPKLRDDSSKTAKITAWYRITQFNGQPVEEFNHFDDGHLNLPNPPPRGGNTFTGKWTFKHLLRTTGLTPKLIE